MDASVASSIIAGIGVILTAWLGFIGNKKGTLSAAEQDFRKAILEDNEKLRKRVDELEKKLTKVLIDNRRLQLKIIELTGMDDDIEQTTGECHCE